jgi:hypothetical protein
MEPGTLDAKSVVAMSGPEQAIVAPFPYRQDAILTTTGGCGFTDFKLFGQLIQSIPRSPSPPFPETTHP